MQARPLIGVALAFGSLAACSIISDIFPSPPPAQVTVENQRDAARALLLDQCPVVPFRPVAGQRAILPGLAVAGAEIATNLLVTALTDFIQQTQTDLTATYTAYGTGMLFDSTGAFSQKCLVVVRGRFGKPSQLPTAQSGVLKPSDLAALGLVDFPKLYFEAWIASDASGPPGRVILTPTALQFADTAARNPGDGKKSIEILLAIANQPDLPTQSGTAPAPIPPPPPAAGGAAQPAAGAAGGHAGAAAPAADGAGGASLAAGNKGTAPAGASSNLVVIPFEFDKVARGSALAATAANAEGVDSPLFDQRRSATISAGGSGGPAKGTLNLYAFITETANPDGFSKVVLSTLPQSQSTIESAITTAIQDALSPAKAPAKTPAK